MTRYSREDALTEREFEQLVKETYELEEPYDIQTRFILFAAGMMGMRGGEIAHFRGEWVDWSAKMVRIPRHDDCDFGTDGDVCGYCKNRARDYMETHNQTIEEKVDELREHHPHKDERILREIAETEIEDDEITMDEALEMRWQPKTEAAIRSIPFDFDVRIELAIEEFCEEYSKFPVAKATINRRVNRVVESSPVERRVYPHSLRATAATIHASRSVSPYALMGIMGWKDIETARSYINSSDETAAREIRSAHR